MPINWMSCAYRYLIDIVSSYRQERFKFNYEQYFLCEGGEKKKFENQTSADIDCLIYYFEQPFQQAVKHFCEVGITDDVEDDLTGPTYDKQEDFWKSNIT